MKYTGKATDPGERVSVRVSAVRPFPRLGCAEEGARNTFTPTLVFKSGWLGCRWGGIHEAIACGSGFFICEANDPPRSVADALRKGVSRGKQ